jgi:hypothetical protein
MVSFELENETGTIEQLYLKIFPHVSFNVMFVLGCCVGTGAIWIEWRV